MRSFGPKMKSDSLYTGCSYMKSIISHSHARCFSCIEVIALLITFYNIYVNIYIFYWHVFYPSLELDYKYIYCNYFFFFF